MSHPTNMRVEARVRVLGPTTIDGTTPTRAQAAIVAALALGGTRPTSTEQLIDAVWTEKVPPSARQSLQNQITRLRRRFGDGLVTTGRGGYLLGWRADVDDFERTVAPWLERPPARAAIEPLAAGLSLWRGEPFQELTGLHEADAERTRLVTLRDDATEQLARARIRAGDLRRAAADLAAHVHGTPYCEQLWGLWMLALHLDGRRTDALAVYRDAAERLGDDLGVEPSEPLRRLRDQVERGGDVDPVPWVGPDPGPTEHGCGTARRGHGRCRTRVAR